MQKVSALFLHNFYFAGAIKRCTNAEMKQSKAHILVVEDDPAILGGLQDVLVFNGYSTQGVADGGDGLGAALVAVTEGFSLQCLVDPKAFKRDEVRQLISQAVENAFPHN